MALAFFKTTNSTGLGIIVRDIHSSLIIVHTELIPCQGDPLWPRSVESATLLSWTGGVCQLIVVGINSLGGTMLEGDFRCIRLNSVLN